MLGPVRLVLLMSCLLGVSLAVKNAGNSFLSANTGKCAPQQDSYGIGNRATCTFTRVLDIDSHRIPPELPGVKCKCPGNLCSPLGDFRCQEVKEKIKVSYVRDDDSGALKSQHKTVEVTTACVCAMTRAQKGRDEGVFRTMDVTDNSLR